MKEIIRSLEFSLKFANTGKILFLEKLWDEYSQVLGYFLWMGAGRKEILSYEEVKKYPYETKLSKRYLGNALTQANNILKGWFKKKDKNKKNPVVKKISMKLDCRFFKFEKGQNSFDYWLLIRNPFENIWVKFPIKSYEYANRYFQEWVLCNEIEILKRGKKWFVKLMFKKKVELIKKEPKGIDIGYRKLIVTSNNEVFGEHIKGIIEEIDRKQQGSKNWKAKKHYLKTELNRVLKRVIDGSFSPVIENLKNLKKGKKSKWAKSVNRKFNNWTYSYTLKRIGELCEVAGVQWHRVPPQFTSTTCPECGLKDRSNRDKELFHCVRCGFTSDADFVGAHNILIRYLDQEGRDNSPLLGRALIVPYGKELLWGRNKCYKEGN